MIINFINFLNFYKKSIFIISTLTIALYVVFNSFFGYFCFSEAIFGLPCPACGLTRATILLLKGNLYDSFKMHPLVLPVLLYFVLLFITYFKYIGLKKYLELYLITLILVSFAVFFYRLFYFFGIEPIVINKQSLLHKVYNFIEIYILN